jgi:hypothetical protein
MTTPLSGEGQQRPGIPRSDLPDSPSVESAFWIVGRAVSSLCGSGDVIPKIDDVNNLDSKAGIMCIIWASRIDYCDWPMLGNLLWRAEEQVESLP